MEESKTKKSSRNLIVGVALKLYQIFIPFIIRTIIIKVLGLEYAGLNSLFTSIIHVLNIAELGVGTALVFSMYKPIKENDSNKICSLMNLYKIYYRIIGLVVLLIGCSLVPFLPNLIKGTIPNDINIYVIYFLNLFATVCSYWLFAYKNSLFIAHQRNDIISGITIIMNTLMYSLQILFLIFTKSYYAYLIILFLSQILTNITIAIAATKKFPNYTAKGKLDVRERKKINSSIKDLFYGQLGMVVTTAVDSLVISIFLGLVPLAIFQNYNYIINAIIGFFAIFFQSSRASMGSNLLEKSLIENYKDFKFITFIFSFALSLSVSCLLCLYQPFMEIWVGVESLLDNYTVILFVIYLVVYELSILFSCYKDAKGKWHHDRFRPLITALVNLCINISLVKFIGLYGILISTIVSFIFINIPWVYNRLFIDVFSIKLKKDYSNYILHKLVILLIIACLNVFICLHINIDNLYICIFVRLMICCIITTTMFLLANYKDEALQKMLRFIKKIKKHKENVC